jgi:hypothetical protein
VEMARYVEAKPLMRKGSKREDRLRKNSMYMYLIPG